MIMQTSAKPSRQCAEASKMADKTLGTAYMYDKKDNTQ